MLEYVALGFLIFAAVTLFYGVIVVHDIPYEIAEKRHHPHADAIHVAGWVSLFTLHTIWPFLWIWATLYRQDRGWGFSKNAQISANQSNDSLSLLQEQVDSLRAQLDDLKAELSSPSSQHAQSEIKSEET